MIMRMLVYREPYSLRVLNKLMNIKRLIFIPELGLWGVNAHAHE